MNPTILLLIGTIFISFATYKYSFILPGLEFKINETYLDLDQHMSETRNTQLMSSFYELKDIRYQMDEFQRNILIQIKSSPNSISNIEARMIKNALNTTKGFAILSTGNNKLKAINEYEDKVNSIMKNNNLDFEEKIKEIDLIKDKEINRINNIQKGSEDNFSNNKKNLKELKDKLKINRTISLIIQIIGLFCICMSQLMLATTS